MSFWKVLLVGILSWGLAVAPSQAQGVLGAYKGTWDGAIFDRSGQSKEVSFEVKSGTGGLTFDVSVLFDGKEGLIGFDEKSNGKLDIVNVRTGGRLPVALRGAIRTPVQSLQGRDYFVFNTQGDADGYGIVFRRPEERGDKPLQQACDESYENWARDRNHARELARDLRVEYHPALAAYDETEASMGEVLLAAKASGVDFASIVYECAFTSPYFFNYQRMELLDGILDMEAISLARQYLGRNGEYDRVEFQHPSQLAEIGEAVEAAEARLPGILAAADTLSSPDAILDFVSDHAKDFSGMRPSVLRAALQDVSERLETAGRDTAEQLANDRIARAAERLAGVETPDAVSGKWRSSFELLMAGKMSDMTGEEISLFGGLVAGALDGCQLPSSPVDRMALLGLVMQGVDRGMGTEFATGDVEDAVRSSFANSAVYAEGVDLAEAIGCEHPYLSAALANLVDLSHVRGSTDGNRASLFVRSCSLDRSPEQCSCMAREMQSVYPSIDDYEYDRSMIAGLVISSPGVALRMSATCGVSNY